MDTDTAQGIPDTTVTDIIRVILDAAPETRSLDAVRIASALAERGFTCPPF